MALGDGAAIVKQVIDSGLRGRGGAGFPTGIKWKTVLATPASQKFIVCNADEGDSGTFSDRMLMEGDPYTLVEGMAIAGLAVGATQGYVYIRSEYPHAFAAMTEAVAGRLAAVGRAVIIDVHSYPSVALPYELHGAGPRPPVCLGTGSFHTPPELTAAARDAFADCGGTGVDSPFGGAYVPLEFYGTDARVGALMVEIRRDTYMTEPGGPAGPGLTGLASALAALVDAVTG